VIPYLFDNVIQYTTSKLREISLNVLRECPRIIRHLADHCPNLRVLKISCTILEIFSIVIPDLARLVDRITTLELSRFDRRTSFFAGTREDLSKKLITNFKSLFQLLQRPQGLTHLRLPFAPNTAESIQILRSALGRLVNLTCVSIPLDSDMQESGIIFTECRSLQRVELTGMTTHNPDVFVPTLLRALSQCPVGDRIFLRSNSQPYGSFFQRAMSLVEAQNPIRFFDWLNESGFVGPLSGETISLVLAVMGVSNGSEFIGMLESDQRPHWLPHLRDVIEHVRSSSFWCHLVGESPISVFQSMVSRVGVPHAQGTELIIAALSAGKIETLQYFEKLGLMTRENLMQHEESIFVYADTLETFQCLRRLLNPEDARTLLFQRARHFHSAFLHYVERQQTQIVDACLEWDPTLLCLPNEADFVGTALYLGRRSSMLQYLPRLVEATGVEKISAATRAVCLWDSMATFSADSHFWIDFILSDPNVMPDFFARVYFGNKSYGMIETLTFETSTDGLLRLADVLMMFQDAILRQMRALVSVDTASALVSSLFLFLYRFRSAATDPFAETSEIHKIYVSAIKADIFIPFCKRLVQLGGCPTARILSACGTLYTTASVDANFMLEACFSVENLQPGVHKILDQLRDVSASLQPSRFQLGLAARCFELIANHIGADALNRLADRPQRWGNLMDFILSPDVASRLTSKSETIHKLVHLGGRVSFAEAQEFQHTKTLHNLYDIEGIEIYSRR
jgi:hypothetical protein